ncbi:hypothetical protein [Oceanobacillus damuensis]|uniref:hypothetical protein n=1 Tax=Oceanobacillus damuensis TaxID=937928 RepID=UPI000A635DC5|nr:hypothetical protein [Oceanobacillus damuensis]
MEAIEERLVKKARRHKKWREDHQFVPHYLVHNDCNFYAVEYEKRSPKQLTNLAIFTTGETVPDSDRQYAIEKMVMLRHLMSLSLQDGISENSLEVEELIKMKNFMQKLVSGNNLSEIEERYYLQGKESIEFIIDERKKQLYDTAQFRRLIEEREKSESVHTEDVDALENLLMEIDYSVFVQLHVFLGLTKPITFIKKQLNKSSREAQLADVQIRNTVEKLSNDSWIKAEILRSHKVQDAEDMTKKEFKKAVRDYYYERKGKEFVNLGLKVRNI